MHSSDNTTAPLCGTVCDTHACGQPAIKPTVIVAALERMVDGVTAVSNRTQSFPLSLSHSSAVSFNLHKNTEHQPSTEPCPQVPPMSPPRAIGLSSTLAPARKGGDFYFVSNTLLHFKCGGPSPEKVCGVFSFFFFLTLHSISGKQKQLDS